MHFKIKAVYIISVCQLSLALGQSLELEHECNILATLEALKEKVGNLESKIKILENEDSTKKVGSTFTRWGRTSCPGNGSELVYSGYAGSSWYSSSGAAAEFICLPTDPLFSHFEEAKQGGGYVYGVEYDFYDRIDRMAFFPNLDKSVDLFDKDVPCAVCTTTRTSNIMVPARNKCIDDWTIEYKGYLVSGYSGHSSATQYICLDDEPEYLSGGARDDNGKLIYFVESRCGSLKCPPYIDGRELTCAVCSK